MAYKGYTKKKGKSYGPYYYKSYRKDGVVKKIYLGRKPPVKRVLPQTNNINWILFAGLFITLGVLIGFFISNPPTGQATLTIETQSTYVPYEPLIGQATITILEGEEVQKDLEVNIVILKDDIVLAESTMTLEEFLGDQINYVELTKEFVSCENVSVYSEEEVCEEVTGPESVEEICTQETKEVCQDELLENGTIGVCEIEEFEVCENVTIPGETTFVCSNQTLEEIEENCTTTNVTDYYYTSPGIYSADLNDLIDYDLADFGQYVLRFGMPDIDVGDESTFEVVPETADETGGEDEEPIVNDTITEPIINETIGNETILNETIFNETILNETLLNQTLINETITNLTLTAQEVNISAFGFGKGDVLEYRYSDVGLTYSCSYYWAKNPSVLAVSAKSEKNKLKIKNFVEKKGKIKKGTDNWEVLDESEKDVLVGKKIAKKIKSLEFVPGERKSVRFCAEHTFEIGSEADDFAAKVEIDHIPEFMGFDYPEMTWWNVSWSYSKNITITNNNDTQALTNYSISIDPNIYNTTGLVLSTHFSEGDGSVALDSSGNNNKGTHYGNTFGLWDLDENTGTSVYDATPYENDGTLSGGPTWTTGKSNYGLSFDGTNDYVNLGTSSPFRQSSAITYSFWVKMESGVPANSIMGVGASGGQGYGGVSFNLSRIWFTWTPTTPGSDTSIYNYTLSLSADTWHHIVVAVDFDGEQRAFYINGEEIGTTMSQSPTDWTPVGSYNSGLTDSIGARYVNSWDYSNSTIDEVAVYSKALNLTDALELYNAGKAKFADWTTNGKYGNAMEFDGVDDYIEIPHTNSLDLGAAGENYSVEAWVKPNIVDSAADMIIIKRPVAGGSFPFALYITSNNYFNFEMYDGVNNPYINSLTTPSANNWYHVVGVRDSGAGDLKIYVNGVFEDSASFTSSDYSVTTPVLIGQQQNIWYFNGTIDEVSVHSRVMSDSEILERYEAGKARLDYADLRFVEGSTELDYWMETDDKFWAEIPSLAAGSSTTVQMYYGNPNADSNSNSEATFDFFDGFDGSSLDTTKWSTSSVSTNAAYSVNGSALIIYGTGSNGQWNKRIVYSNTKYNVSDYTIDAMVNYGGGNGTSGGTGGASGYFGYINSTLAGGSGLTTGARFWYRAQFPINWVDRRVFIYDYSIYNLTTSASGGLAGSANSSAVRTLLYDDINISAFENYVLFNSTNKTLAMPQLPVAIAMTKGDIGPPDPYMVVDWIRLRKHISPEPTVTFVSSEDAIPINVTLALSTSTPLTGRNVTATGSVKNITGSAIANNSISIYINDSLLNESNIVADNVHSLAWWNNSWSYRKEFTVTNNNDSLALTNYAVAIDPNIYNTTGLMLSTHFSEGDGSAVGDSSGKHNKGTHYGNTIMFMPMDENTSNIASDYSTFGNNGSLVGDTAWTSGKSGSGLVFDGVNDYVNIADADELTPNPEMTWEAWIYPTDNETSGVIIAKGGSVASSYEWAVVHSPGGILYSGIYTCSGGAHMSVSSSASMPINTWSHVAVTFEEDTSLKLYVNGVPDNEDTTVTSGFCGNAASTVRIGYRPDNLYPFNGTIDEVVIYSKALSAAEISAHYNASRAKFADWTTNGKYGNAMEFDGVDDYVAIGDDSSLSVPTGGKMTIEGWFNWYDNGASARNTILSKYDDVGSGWEYSLAFYSDVFTITTTTSGGGVLYNKGVSSVQYGEWTHFAAILNQDNGYIWTYINGVEQGSPVVDTSGSMSNTAARLTFGREYGSGQEWFGNGTLDEVRIYNRSLSADEISEHYNAGKARLDYADLRFVEGSTELDYWMETDDKFWAEIPSVAADSSTTVQIYYGNQNAESSSNGSATFDFFDEFSTSVLDPDKWTEDAVNDISQRVSNGAVRITGATTSGSTYWIYDNTDTGSQHQAKGLSSIDNISIEWEATTENTGDMGGVGLALVDASNLVRAYELYGDGTGGNGAQPTRRWQYETTGGSESASVPETKNFKMTRLGATVKFYIDDVLKATGTLTGTPAEIAIAVGTFGGYTFLPITLDNVRVRNYITPEPTASAGLEAYLMQTDSSGNYNYTFMAPSTAGTYVVKVNSSYGISSDEKESTMTLQSGAIYTTFDGSTTSFNDEPDISSVSQPILENSSYGKIVWHGTADAAGADFDSYVNISSNFVKVESANLDSTFNSSANITLYGLSFDNPGIVWDPEDDGTFIKCPDNICAKVNYSGGNLIFNTTQFSGFSGEELPNVTLISPADNLLTVNTTLTFIANITAATNLTNASFWHDINGSFVLNDTWHYGNIEADVDTMGLWHFDEGDGNETADSSGNLNDGVHYGNTVALWRFDENTGTTVGDESPYNNAGTLNGDTSWTVGKSGSALSFDGDGDYVDVGSAVDAPSVISISAWINTSTSDQYMGIVAKYISTDPAYLVQVSSSGGVAWRIDDGTTSNNLAITSTSKVNDSNWHHIVATWDGGGTTDSIKIYIDGVSEGTAAENGDFVAIESTAEPLRIGYYRWDLSTFRYFNGTIDEVAIYNKSLTPAEVSELYNAGKAKFTDWTNSSKLGGYALEFDGDDDYVQIVNDASLSSFTEYTLTSWIKHPAAAGAVHSIMDKWNAGFDWQLAITSSGTIYFPHGNSSNVYTELYSTATVDDGLWHSVVATWKSGEYGKIYIDGILNATANTLITGATGTLDDMYIGIWKGSAFRPFNGTIDEVVIYNRSLSASEIKAHYQRKNYATSDSVNWTVDNIPVGPYNWNVEAYDSAGQSDWGDSNYTFNVGSINSCGVTLAESGSYVVSQSISTTVTCITIGANDVEVDCQGYTMTGDGSGLTDYGIDNTGGYDNVTIKNCIMTDFTRGIYFSSANNGTIFNNSFSSSFWQGIYVASSNNNLIKNNTASGGSYGILIGGSNNNVTGNTLSGTSQAGISVASSYNNVEYNTLSSSSGVTIKIEGTYNNITGNTINSANLYSLWILGASNRFVGNNAGGGARRIYVGTNGNTFIDNTANSASQYGFYLTASSNNVFINNTASGNGIADFYSTSSSTGNIVTNLTSYQNVVSFTSKDIALKGLTTAQAPTDPTYYYNITKYLNITNNAGDSWIYLNVSYDDSDVPVGINESTLRLWKNNASGWTQVSGINSVDTTNNIVYANITEFGSTFAPLAPDFPPNITLINPTDNVVTSNTTLTFFANLSDDYNLINASLWHNISGTFALNDTWYYGNLEADGDTVGLWHFDEGDGNATTDNSSSGNDGVHYGNTIALWHFDENTGTTAGDESPYNNDGTFVSAPIWTTGKSNYALDFDGVDDYVNVGDIGIGETPPFTIEAWYKPNPVTSLGIYMEGNSANAWPIAGVFVSGGRIYNYYRNNDGSVNANMVGPVVNDSSWHHVAYVVTASNDHKLYSDGVLVNSSTTDVTPLSLDTANIGSLQRSGADYYYNGTIDEVAVYSKALSAAEVSEHYNASKAKFTDWTNISKLGDYAMEFDGADDYVDAGNDVSLQITGALTISAWIKTSTLNYSNVVSKWYNEDTPRKGYSLVVRGDDYGEVFFDIEGSAGYDVCYSDASVNDGEWHNIAGVFYADGSTRVKVYIDGEEDNCTTRIGAARSDIVDTGKNLGVGKQFGPYNTKNVPGYYNGTIDEVVIYNRTLSADEIRAHYQRKNYATSDSVNWTIDNIPVGTYEWNVQAFDSAGQSDWADSNWTFSVGEISGCSTISESGVYTLTQNLSTSGTCINITSDDVTLDCQGYTINGTEAPNKYGIVANGFDSVIINNCIITNFYWGIYFNNVTNGTVTNSTANSNSAIGIYLASGSNNNLVINNIANFNANGIYIWASSNNITNNTANSNTNMGIVVEAGSNNTLTSNTASANGYYGIYLRYNSDNNIFINNNATGNTQWDFYSWVDPLNNTVINLTTQQNLVSFTSKGIALKGLSSGPTNPTTGYYGNLGYYVNVTNTSTSSWAYLNFSYTNSDVTNFPSESSVAIWKHNGTDWIQDGWNGTRVSDTTNNVVGVNITDFGSIFAPLGVTATEVTSCPIAISSAGTYILNSNLSISTSNPWQGCIYVSVNDVVLDCQGNWLNDDGSSWAGVEVPSVNNVTVKNCGFFNFTNVTEEAIAIYLYDVSNSSIINNTVYVSTEAIGAEYSVNITIANNTVDNTTWSGIFGNTNDSVYSGNVLTNISRNGLSISGRDEFGDFQTMFNNVIENNIIVQSGGTRAGLHLRFLNNTLVRNNTLIGGTMTYGIRARFMIGNSTFANNTIDDYGVGIVVDHSFDNTFTDDIVTGSGSYDIYTFNSTGIVFSNIVVNNTLRQTNISLTGENVTLLVSNTSVADPSGYKNISHFINMTNLTADGWAYVNISYEDSDVPADIGESSLKIYKYNGTDWVLASSDNGVDTTNNFVYANITDFGSTFAPFGSTSLLVCVVNQTTCDAGYTDVLHMSNYTNAHAEMYNETDYADDYLVCCKDAGGLVSIGTNDNGTSFLRLSNYTDAHVEKASLTDYDFLAYISGSSRNISCSYSTSCTGNQTCLATISNDTDAHIADCVTDPYDTKVCCEFYITNQAPQVTFVQSISSTNPVEATSTSVEFNITVYDPDGFGDIDDSSVRANFTKAGVLREEILCTPLVDYNSSYTNYSCAIDMWYFDSEGNWNVTVYAKDNSAVSAINDSTYFSYNQLQAITLSLQLVDFGNVTTDSYNQTAETSTIINNTGNYNATGKIAINALNLLGEIISGEYISAENISVGINSGGAECAGTSLNNASDILISGIILEAGNLSTGAAQEQINYCILFVPRISSQSYSTLNSTGWTVKLT